MEKMKVKIKYWQQETLESGRWVKTDYMDINIAKELIGMDVFERGEIVFPEDFLDV